MLRKGPETSISESHSACCRAIARSVDIVIQYPFKGIWFDMPASEPGAPEPDRSRRPGRGAVVDRRSAAGYARSPAAISCIDLLGACNARARHCARIAGAHPGEASQLQLHHLGLGWISLRMLCCSSVRMVVDIASALSRRVRPASFAGCCSAHACAPLTLASAHLDVYATVRPVACCICRANAHGPGLLPAPL